MKTIAIWLPLALFAMFFGVVANGLINPTTPTIVSKMVGKPLPSFALPPAHDGQPGLTSADFKQGQPRLLNIFASWCVPCIAEAPILLQLKQAGIPINSIAIRDRPADVSRFLDRNGNPYQRIGSDVDSSVQLALGSSGVPETFVVDGRGIIRYQHIGDIRREDVGPIMAAMKAAQ